jgi:hypothetical protein
MPPKKRLCDGLAPTAKTFAGTGMLIRLTLQRHSDAHAAADT